MSDRTEEPPLFLRRSSGVVGLAVAFYVPLALVTIVEDHLVHRTLLIGTLASRH